MADTPDADQKTEAPTDKRRRESADNGEVFQSRELATLLLIGAGVVWLWTAGPDLVEACRAVLRAGLTLGGSATPLDPGATLAGFGRGLVLPLLTFAAIVFAGSVLGPLVTAPRFSAKAFAPKLSRINPAAGLKRMVGSQALVELGKAVLKAALLSGTCYLVLSGQLPVLLAPAADPIAAGTRVGGAVADLLLALTLALAVIAAVDLPLQFMRHMAKLRMSKHEIKEESRESEGSPETKAAQRRMARQSARRALAPAMAEATVVVVNPAHFAVALRYLPGHDAAPIVVARGRDVIAAAIRDLAAENKVPILRYPQLTRAIFFTAQVGAPIRDDLFAAVAAVLAFVFTLDDAAAARDQPDVEVPPALRFDERGIAA